MEVHEANLGAVNYHKVELEEATPEDRGQRQHPSQKPVMKRSQRKRQRRLPKWSTEAKNLDDDEKKIHDNLTLWNKVTEEHSQQQARRAQPTAGREGHS